MRPIAIRLFENKTFGTTYGKGLRRTAVFNATAEITDPYAKYLLDFEEGRAWANHARTEAQLKIARDWIDRAQEDDAVLWSWVKWYDKASGAKEYVTGFALYDMEAEEIVLHLADDKRGLMEEWFLPARRCRGTVGRNSPVLLATNHDLTQ